MAEVAEVTPEAQLAWEKEQRPRAAVASGLGGTFMIGGLVIAGITANDQPSALLIDSLGNLAKDGPIGEETTNRLSAMQYALDHNVGLMLSVILLAAGVVGVGIALTFLARCAKARKPDFPRLALLAPAVGAGIAAIGLLLVFFGQDSYQSGVVDGARTVDAAAQTSTGTQIGYAIELLGLFFLAGGAIITALNAMRVGLLTRTMGILGIFAGVAIVLFGPSQPLIPLWVVFLTPMFLGRWLGGHPPAWSTGKAEPWPSSAELRAERIAKRDAMKGGSTSTREPVDEPERVPVGKPHPSSKKRKRKKRG